MLREYDVSHRLSVSSYISTLRSLSGPSFAVRCAGRQEPVSLGRPGRRIGCPASLARPPAGAPSRPSGPGAIHRSARPRPHLHRPIATPSRPRSRRAARLPVIPAPRAAPVTATTSVSPDEKVSASMETPVAASAGWASPGRGTGCVCSRSAWCRGGPPPGQEANFRHSGTARTRSYGVNAPFMQLQRHGWDIHAVSARAGETRVGITVARDPAGSAVAPGVARVRKGRGAQGPGCARVGVRKGRVREGPRCTRAAVYKGWGVQGPWRARARCVRAGCRVRAR